MSKICKRVFKEIAVAPDRKGRPIFSFCCYMQKYAWFRATTIREALSSGKAKLIMENAVNNKYGYCAESCPNWEDGDTSDLRDLSLERFEISASTRCNARCVFCFQANYNLSLPASIIDEWRRDYLPSVRHMAFGGGEPLLVASNLIKEVVEKRSDVTISLVTNGILLDRTVAFNHRLSGINISLNAGSREVYKRVMNVDAFDRVLGNLRNLRRAGYVGPISSTYVICRENVADIRNFVSICADVGIIKVGFNVDRTDPFFRVPQKLGYDIKRYAEAFGTKVSIGILHPNMSVAGKGKQVFLYFLRYRPRRRRLRRMRSIR